VRRSAVIRKLFFLWIWAALFLPGLALADDFGKDIPKWLDLLNNGISKEKRLALYNLWPVQSGRYGEDARIWKPILGALFDKDSAVREAAADFLKTMGESLNFENQSAFIGCCKETEIIPSLIKALEDPNPRVRAEVAAALGHYYGYPTSPDEIEREQRAISTLIKKLKDPDPWVRLNVAFSLGELKTEKRYPKKVCK
jgi:HEAT repeat protein